MILWKFPRSGNFHPTALKRITATHLRQLNSAHTLLCATHATYVAAEVVLVSLGTTGSCPLATGTTRCTRSTEISVHFLGFHHIWIVGLKGSCLAVSLVYLLNTDKWPYLTRFGELVPECIMQYICNHSTDSWFRWRFWTAWSLAFISGVGKKNRVIRREARVQ